jgi:hypothetical protein
MKTSHSRSSLHLLILLSLLFSLAGGALVVTPARADTHTISDCNAPDGNASRLLEQIAAASPGDTLNFSCSGTITLYYRIWLNKDLTIDGSGQTVTISGGNSKGIFWIPNGNSLTLHHLTIANGNATSDGSGAIVNYGTLVISNSTFSNNQALDNAGGAIQNAGGTLVITNSTFTANSAGSIVGGGAIYQQLGTVTITNSTFVGNRATGTDANGGAVKNGGGGTLTLVNTLLAQNTPGGNCGGGISNGGNNLEDGSTCDWAWNPQSSLSDTDPLLGTLTGFPAYFPLLPASPAIDKGNDTACNAAPVSGTSQNGLTRPQGMHCDIGSYEAVRFTTFLPLVRR